MEKSNVDVSSRKDNLSDIVGRDRDKHKFICMHPCFFIFIFGNFDLSRQYKYQVVGFYLLLLIVEIFSCQGLS